MIDWQRTTSGCYEADADGIRWRIVDEGTRWVVYRDRDVDATWPTALVEAKAHVTKEISYANDPAMAEFLAWREEKRRAAA